MIFKIAKQVSALLVVIIFLLLLLAAEQVKAAEPYGVYGWVGPIVSLDGDDVTTCGPSEIALTLEVRDRNTDLPIVTNSGIIAVRNLGNNLFDDWQSGSGPRIGPVCYDPDIHAVAYDIDGGSTHYNFYSSYVDSAPAIMPRQKSATGVVWVTPVGTPIEYSQVSPAPNVVTIASSSPSYVYAVNHIHSAYGATGLSRINFFVVEFDPFFPPRGRYTNNIVVSKDVVQSGGVGTKTIPAETLVDGWYGWALYLHLNRDIDIGYSVDARDLTKSGLVEPGAPFILDTTPPEITLINNEPISPTTDETATVEIVATDALTGITQIDVFINGALADSCTYASVFSAACQTTVASLTAGTYSYYAVVYDTAGNSRVSDTSEFTVIAAPTPTPLSCEFPDFTILDTAQAWNGSWYSGLQAMKKVGNYVYTGGSGGNDVNGLYVYDISDPENISQLSFLSTHNPEAVRNNSWGNRVVSVEVDGQYAYLVTHRGGLVIVDVSNPADPLFIGKLALPNESWDVRIRGNLAYIASANGLIVVNISNKSNPTLVANLSLGATVSQNLVLSGDYAYLAIRSQGVRVVDISNPNNPILAASITDGYFPGYPDGSWAYSVEVKGNYLYVADHFQEQMSVFNIFNPAAPVRVSTVSVPGATHPDSPRVLTVVEDVLYVGAGRYGLYVFDITNPSNPTELYNIAKPPILAGTIWNVLPIDDSNFQRITFVTEDINAALYTMEIECEQTPNLEAGIPSVTPDVVAPEEVITITAEIENDGAIAAGPYNVWIIIDADGDGAHEYELPVVRIDSDTGAGLIQNINVNWTVPAAALASSNYRVGYFADINNEVDEGAGDHENANWSGWSDPFTVALPSVPELSGSGCSIALGESECQGLFNWNIDGVTDPNLYNATRSSVCSTEPSGVNENCLLQYGTNNMQVRSGTTVLRGLPVVADCADGAWDAVASQCVTLPDLPLVRIEAERVVRSGATTSIEIGIIANYDVTCQVYGATSDSSREINHGASGTETVYTLVSKQLFNAQIIRVTCTILGVEVSEFVRIQVEAKLQEI